DLRPSTSSPPDFRPPTARRDRYPASMTRAALDYVLWDMGQAFDMLFANLKDLRDDDWAWLPEGAARSIRAIVGHVASCKIMYDNYAFGDASMTWMDPRFGEAQSPAEGTGFSPQTL